MDTFTRAELPRLVNATKYPGVDPTEVRVLREWIRREGDRYDELRFNVRVGAGVQLAGDFTEKFKADWERRTKMRLDCVGFNPPHVVTLVEAKVQWTNDAVWQLLGYRDQYVAEYPEAMIDLAGVCEAYTPSALQLAGDQGIRLFVFGFADTTPASSSTTGIGS